MTSRRFVVALVAVWVVAAVASPADATRRRPRPPRPPVTTTSTTTTTTRPPLVDMLRPMNVAHAAPPAANPYTPWHTWDFDDSTNRRLVTGAFVGTTDATLVWAATKWQLDPDVIRAVAVIESWWDMTTLGDGAQSHGLMQIKVGAAGNVGVTLEQAMSMPWNVDYYAARLRACLDGHMALWRDRPDLTVRPYTPGDLVGCIEGWYTGVGPTVDSAWYGARFVENLATRRWEHADFVAWAGWRVWCAANPGYPGDNCTTGQGS